MTEIRGGITEVYLIIWQTKIPPRLCLLPCYSFTVQPQHTLPVQQIHSKLFPGAAWKTSRSNKRDLSSLYWPFVVVYCGPTKISKSNQKFALSGGSLISCNAVTVQPITAHGRSSNTTQIIWISRPQLLTVYSNSSLSYRKVITLKAKHCFVSVSSVLTTYF